MACSENTYPLLCPYLIVIFITGSQNHYEGDDRLSQTSVQNTEEYLARLGIDIRKPPNVKLPTEDPYSAQGGGGQGSIYNRIGDEAMSEHNSTISTAKPHSLLYGSTGRQVCDFIFSSEIFGYYRLSPLR